MNRHRLSSLAALALMLALIAVLSSCKSNSYSTNPSYPNNPGNPNNPPPSPNSVSISGLAFNPSSLTVKVGTKVTWTNNDATVHTVTSNNGAFTSSGQLATGEQYQFTFMTAGSYSYHCSIHAYMTGTITVTP